MKYNKKNVKIFVILLIILLIGFSVMVSSLLLDRFRISENEHESIDFNEPFLSELLKLEDDKIIELVYTVEDQTYSLLLEVARSPEKQAIGLMNREELNAIDGMIFIFDSEENRTFWMKNTLIPLDIIFINSNLEVVNIHKNTSPDQTVQRYSSKAPAQLVIELNANKATGKGFQGMSKITIQNIEKK